MSNEAVSSRSMKKLESRKCENIKRQNPARKEKVETKSVSNSSKRISDYMSSSVSGSHAKKEKKDVGVGPELIEKVDFSAGVDEFDFDDDEQLSDHFDSGIGLIDETSRSFIDSESNIDSLESLKLLCQTRQNSLDEQLRENFRLHQERLALKQKASELDDALKEGREILAVFDAADSEEKEE